MLFKIIKKRKYICLVELLILIVMVGIMFKEHKNKTVVDIPAENWQSEYADDMGGWYINSEIAGEEGEVEFLSGPNISMQEGAYTAHIWYECEANQEIFLPDENTDIGVKAGDVRLNRNANYIAYKFTLTEDVQNFRFIIGYDGNGSFKISNIEIMPNLAKQKADFVLICFLFLVLDSFLFFYNYIQRNRNLILEILGIVIISSLPLFLYGIAQGHDLRFHLMRIEGIAHEIRMGNVPVRLSSLWMEGYGYPVSVYYGDMLLYIPALFRLAGFSVTEAYKIYIFFINLGTSIISYCCFDRMFRDKKIAWITTLAYVTGTYRLVNLYVRAAVGEYSAQMFLPIIALAIYGIYKTDIEDWRKYRWNALFLAIGMSGIIGTHILSTEMVVFTLVFVCMIMWKKTFRRKTLCVYFLAVLETLGLNMYFIVPFMDYYKNVSVKISDTVNSDAIGKIQEKGAYISQYFSFFESPFGETEILTCNRMQMTPGCLLMLALIVGIVLWVNGKADREIKRLVFFSITILYLSSTLFPWNYIAREYGVGNVLAQVQFPWRYIGIAGIFLTLLLGSILKAVESDEQKMKYICIGSAVGICSMLFFVSEYCKNGDVVNFYEAEEFSKYHVMNGEYLRSGTDEDMLDEMSMEAEGENIEYIAIAERNGSSMVLDCIAGKEVGEVELPLFNYKGYQVTDEKGNSYEIEDGKNDVVKFSIPAGFEGKIYVDFKEPWYWRAAEMISMIAVLAVLFLGTKRVKEMLEENVVL